MKLYWPVRVEDGAFIGQKFGEHLADYSQYGWLGHNGIDFPGPLDIKIYAPINCWLVEQTAKTGGYGLRITLRVEQDGRFYQIVLGHMHKFANDNDFAYNWHDKSRPISAGGLIGYVDSTGNSTGNHVHLGLQEMKEDGNVLNFNNGYGGAIDPMPFLADEKDKPTMGEFIHVFNTQEYGLEYTTDFVTTIVKFSSETDAKEKLKNIPSVLKADGNIDFSKAKEIRL